MSRAKTLSKRRTQDGKAPQAKTPPETGSLLTGNRLNTVLCVLLAAVTIVLYSPVTGFSFIAWDDRDYVTANPHIQGGLAWSTIKWAFRSTDAGNWHPLTWLSHALDYQLFALSPWGHHLDSVLIHAANAVLLFLLLAWVSKRVGPSLLVAALFAVHPLNVESVAWVAERKNVLSTLFFLLAIGGYGWYAKKPNWRRYLLVAALFAAGLMAKPMVITLPFVLLLLDYWPLERIQNGSVSTDGLPQVAFSRLVLEKIPLLFLSAASALITLKAQRAAERTFEEFPLAIRVENAVVAYGLYLWKMIWPARLAALYPHPANSLPTWQVILSALILGGVTALVVVFRRKRYLPVGWFWFLGTLVPVIGVVQVGGAAMADRYAYVPLIGIFVMIAWGLDDWAEAKAVPTAWRVIPALCALLALGVVTSRQMGCWRNEYTVWAHTLAVTEQTYAHDALGAALMDPNLAMTAKDVDGLDTEQKRMEAARQHFESALKTRRRQRQQERPDALNVFDIAVELSYLGFLDRGQGRLEEARQNYEEALSICRQLVQQGQSTHLPDLAGTLNDLGALDRQQNRLDEARQHYEEALSIFRQLVQQDPAKYLPNMGLTLNHLTYLDLLQNRVDDGRQHFEEALKIYRQLAQQEPGKYQPYMAEASINLGSLDLIQSRLDEGRQHFEEALNTYRQLAQQDPATYLPDLALVFDNLGKLDGQQNRKDDARQHFEGALQTYRQLAQQDPGRYAGDVARVKASLQELDKRATSR
jgi:tetratricopeptide (TPR) repeat protein